MWSSVKRTWGLVSVPLRVGAVLYLCQKHFIGIYKNEDDSNEPTIENGSYYALYHMFPVRKLQRGDFVSITHPITRDQILRRVAALPGDPIPTDPVESVPYGHLFVTGDNPDKAEDSRKLGSLPLGLITGKLIFKYPNSEKL
eukprot:TRINITY_DN6088_c0_g1_i2.p1 TRINITY_DN6088_c0_g1~~TRINITY_DN6088_c0_g1_i2.p1  ORF type:complete len:142 (+),score=15.93 TRINITY_DN6088_c0_g1_i2:191-616(+)